MFTTIKPILKLNNKTLIIAHRGESYEAPENTLASINLAWNRGADAVEIDVHLTGDNKIAVIHDSHTNRTGDRYKKIKSETLDELKKIDVGKFKGEQWLDEKIPSLEEVFNTIPVGKEIFIEIKCGTEIIPGLQKILTHSKLNKNQIRFISFSLETISSIKKIFPQYEVYWLRNVERRNFLFWKLNPDELIEKVLSNGLDGLDIKASKSINQHFVEKVKKVGLKIFVWTINNSEEAEKFLKLGVDGITTDRPFWLKQSLKINI